MFRYVQINDLVSSYSDDKEVRDFYGDVLALRLKGYRQAYGDESFPLDFYDLIGTHLIIAKEEGSKLKPLIALRSITEDQSHFYGQEFPFLHHMFEDSSHILHHAAKKFIDAHSNVCYTNNYTIEPSLSKEDKAELYNSFVGGLYFNYHTDANISNFITATSDKFKVYRTRLAQGYEYLRDDPEFCTYEANHIMQEKFRVMFLTQFSDWMKEMGEKYTNDFSNRIILGDDKVRKIKKAA